MAITFVAALDTGVGNGGTPTLNLTLLTGLAQNDVVIVFCITSSGTLSAPAWTEIHTDTSVDASVGQAGAWYKVMGASPDTSVAFWDSGTNSDSGCAIAMAFRGVDTSNVMDVAAVEGEGTTAENISAITPTSDNCCIVVVRGDRGTAQGAVTPTAPANYTQPSPLPIARDDDNDTCIGGIYRILTGGGGSPEDPAAWGTWAAESSYGITMALRPAPAGQPYDLHEGGVRFINPHHGGQNFQVWRKALGGLFLPPGLIRV